MDFNLDKSWEYYSSCEREKQFLYFDIVIAADDHPILTRVVAPVFAVKLAGRTSIQRVGTVAELAFKGFCNTLGSPFDARCHFWTGLKQGFIELPYAVIALLLCPIEVAVSGIITTAGVLMLPKQYALYRRNVHQNKADALDD